MNDIATQINLCTANGELAAVLLSLHHRLTALESPAAPQVAGGNQPDVIALLGYLTAAIPELRHVQPVRLLEAYDAFLKREAETCKTCTGTGTVYDAPIDIGLPGAVVACPDCDGPAKAPTPPAPCADAPDITDSVVPTSKNAAREDLLTEIMEYVDPEGGKADQLLLRAASALAETKAVEPKDGVWWLIETFPPDIGRVGGSYYCGPGQWCDNPNHAHQFVTQAMAIEAMNAMASRAQLRVTEHEWS